MMSDASVSAGAPELTKILIYKRTHDGDPDTSGCFGIEDCMGRVRSFGFDGVIGVGGVSAWPVSQGLDRKINWLGRHPQPVPSPKPRARAPALQFNASDFALFEHFGPQLFSLSPALARHVYGSRLRYFVVAPGDAFYADACNIITALLSASPNPKQRRYKSSAKKGCRPNHIKACRPRCK